MSDIWNYKELNEQIDLRLPLRMLIKETYS